jgi:hypothetical protein
MTGALAAIVGAIPATTPEAMEIVNRVEAKMRSMPQIEVKTEHILHAGMYARTVRLGARVAIVSVLIKVPTVLTVNGRCKVFAGEEWREFDGYQVIAAQAGRKMIYVTESPTEITMVFPSKAKTVEEAEREFTDEDNMLLSRQSSGDIVTITGVEPGVQSCLE